MKRSLKKYSDDDFEAAGRIDRLYMTMVQADCFVLTNDESQYLDILTRAYPIICTGRDKADVITQIQHLEEKWRNQAVQIYLDAQDLYGRFEEINPLVLKGIMIAELREMADTMKDLANSAENEQARAKAGDVFRKCWAEIGIVSRLGKADDKKENLPPPPAPVLGLHEMYKNAELATIDHDHNSTE